jgi:hypothetical protein
VAGSTWDVGGDASSIAITGSVDQWVLEVHSDVQSLRLGDVGEATVDVAGRIGSALATRWQRGALTAHTLGSLLTTGKVWEGIDGDFGADLKLSGQGATRHTLGSARVSGTLESGLWDIHGDILSVSVNRWGADACLVASVAPGADLLYFTGDDAGLGGRLSSLVIAEYEAVGGALFGVCADELGSIVVRGRWVPVSGLPHRDGQFCIVTA